MRVIWEGVSETVSYISITLVGILPWCGRQNTQRITQVRARLIQQPKRQGQKLAKLLTFWSYKLHNRKKLVNFFYYRLTQIEVQIQIESIITFVFTYGKTKQIHNDKITTIFSQNYFGFLAIRLKLTRIF